MAGPDLVFVNGDFLPSRAAAVATTDLGLLYGDGIYETLRLLGGRPVDYEAHMERLGKAAVALEIPVNLSTLELGAALMEVARRNGHRDGAARVVVTRGPLGAPNYPYDAGPPGLYLQTRAGTGYAPGLHEAGASMVTSDIRQNADSPVPRLKTLSCLERVLARREAEAAGATEALLLNTRGEVAEGSRSNVWCVRGGVVRTPHAAANILCGVTRSRVLALARARGLEVREERMLPSDLDGAGEVFLTSSLMGVLAVSRLDGRPVGEGVPGPVARALAGAYEAWVGGGR